ncbi:TraM recognition domain-containing protein [Alteromonas sp. 14N.309.X.WAT.G.H12]|uniref:TraM recognition domain-containing protein n=1 Tax=Alteromonas sp. 14N.309.X.WAT.G.H12 TaxID=3120824 RepID=UPI002FD53C45
MSNVKLQGIDSIKFDDAWVDGQKVNLALGKDTRPFQIKYAYFIATVLPFLLAVISLVMAFIIRPMAGPLFLLSIVFTLLWTYKRKRYVASRKGLLDDPKYALYNKKTAAVDYSPKENTSEVEAVNKKLGDGVYFFGHELFTNQEVHMGDSKARTHIIIFGTTGSGKTEAILAICVNFLVQGSGFILVDGKGDSLLFAKVFSLCRAYDRCDDLYVLNFMDKLEKERKRVELNSHSFNFFVESTEIEANEIVGGLLPNDDSGDLWGGRAASGIDSINAALYWLKDNGYLEIDPDSYRSYFKLDEYAKLAMNEDIPKKHRVGLWAVLHSISYKHPTEKDPNPKQESETDAQFQYIVMQYTQTFNQLADVYSHITVSQVPDINITDIVLRRRILLVLLPSLAKSEQNVRNLGRIIIAIARNVSAKAIGSSIEGSVELTIESKPTAAISSFAMIFDEFGTYATTGASTLPSQVRSLNIICIFAGQDYDAFKRGNEIEASTIFGNCSLKICMKLEDPLTYQKFQDSAGQKYVLAQEGFETKSTMFGRKHIPQKTARVEKRDVLDMIDLKKQAPGHATIIFGDMTHRIKFFYPNLKLAKKARLNHMIEVRRPRFETSEAYRVGVDRLYRNLKKRLQGNWEAEEKRLKSNMSFYIPFKDELLDSYSKIDSSEDRSANGAFPSETEMSTFCLSVYLKQVELTDHNVRKGIHDDLGLEFNEQFDDDDLLKKEGGALFDDFKGDSDVFAREDAHRGPPSAETKSDAVGQAGVDFDVPKRPRIDDFAFEQIEQAVERKVAKHERAKAESFDSLESIQIDAFQLTEKIESLEKVLLKREGYVETDAERLSKLTSKNIVTEMGLQTNVAVASQKDKRRTTPARSSKEVRDRVLGLAELAE